ncbi:hypothetical protein D3C80_1931900 [compost metagenome]
MLDLLLTANREFLVNQSLRICSCEPFQRQLLLSAYRVVDYATILDRETFWTSRIGMLDP